MNCEEARDRFSSLWEKELSSAEEKILKEHLSSCPTCRTEFEQFGKTMQWLHSVGEVEAPEGLLRELHKKLEEKKKAFPDGTSGGRWLHFPLSLKLPVQAVAMVAVVFLVLYLTKMMPMDRIPPKEAKQVSSSLFEEKKSEKALGPGGAEEGRRKSEPLAEAPRLKDTDQAKAPVPDEEQLEEASLPRGMGKAKKREAPVRTTEVLGYQAAASKEAARAGLPSPEPRKMEKELTVQEKPLVASKSPQQIILRTSDREKLIPRLNELVKQFGGEVTTMKGDVVLASLPTGSFSEFEKELAGLSSPAKADRLFAKKHAAESLRPEQGAKKEQVDEKIKGSAIPTADAESRTIVHILLVEE